MTLSSTHDLFNGFLVGGADDVWNETPWPNVAVPDGFSYGNLIDYSDVGVLINNLSEESRTIGWAFVAARNISLDRVFLFNQSGTPTGETVNRNQFNTYFALPFLEMLQNRSSSNQLNYLVTTKGIPLRVSGGNDKASFDQELALLGGAYNSSIGSNYWFNHDYGPLAGKAMEPFTRSKYGFFLVTRLTGYTVDTALELIERANQSLGQRGTFVWISPPTGTTQGTNSGTMTCTRPTRRSTTAWDCRSCSMKKLDLSPMSQTSWGTLHGEATMEIGIRISSPTPGSIPGTLLGKVAHAIGTTLARSWPPKTTLNGPTKPTKSKVVRALLPSISKRHVNKTPGI